MALLTSHIWCGVKFNGPLLTLYKALPLKIYLLLPALESGFLQWIFFSPPQEKNFKKYLSALPREASSCGRWSLTQRPTGHSAEKS